MSELRTNIVQLDISEHVTEESRDPVEYSKKLASDAIDFLESEFKEDLTKDFWQLIYDNAKSKLEIKPEEPIVPLVEPMPEDQAKKMLKECIPWGPHVGVRVETILKKDSAALDNMAHKPLLFQVRLKKLLRALEINPSLLPQSPVKTPTKARPKAKASKAKV